MKISFDLDDVLVDFTRTLAPQYNQRYGTQYSEQDFTPDISQWHQLLGTMGLKRLWDMVLDPEYNLAVPPVAGAVEVVRKFKDEGAELVINTSRINVTPGLTEQYLELHFGKAFSKVRYARFNGESDRPTKAEICLEEGAHLHVDDMIRHVVDVSSYRIPVLLMDRPWNQGLLDSQYIKRVRNFEEVVTYAQTLTS